MDENQVIEKTKKELRSLLISAPRGVALPLLAKDYKMVIGKELPYLELGFRNVEQFIDSIPDTVRLGHGPTGLTCYAVANEETKQIARFVASQRKPSLKKSLMPPVAVNRQPVKLTGFSRKSRFGPAHSWRRTHTYGCHTAPFPSFTHHQSWPRASPVRPPLIARPPPLLAGLRPPPLISRPPPAPLLSRPPPLLARPPLNPQREPRPSPIRYPEQRGPHPRPPSSSGEPFREAKLVISLVNPTSRHSDVTQHKKEVISPIRFPGQPMPRARSTAPPPTSKSAISPIRYPEQQTANVGSTHLTRPLSTSSLSSESTTSDERSRTPSSSSVSPPPQSPPTPEMSANDLCTLDVDIFTLLRGHQNGVYGKRLGREYEKNFKKGAPPDILDYAKKLPFVSYEEIVEGISVLYLIDTKSTSDAASVSTATKSAVSAPTTTLVSTPVSTATKRATPMSKSVSAKPSIPGTVELGEADDVVNVEVVFMESVVSFYVQRIGEEFSDKFQCMQNKLSSFVPKTTATAISEDSLYAIRWNEEDSVGEEVWCRVLIRSILKEQNKAYVLCPDFGNSLLVKLSDLKDLPREFYDLPFQAIHCCLDGLHGKDFIDEDKALEAFEQLALNKVCIAQVMESSGSRVSVELIDAESDGLETINSLLLQELCSEAKLSPKLPQPGAEKVAAKLTDIDMDGTITVQLLGPGLNQLEHLMNIINEAYEKPRVADFINKVEVGVLYCACSSADHKWYRAVAKEVISSRKILVEYVDYGNEEEVEKTKLRKKVDHHLFKLPFQAVKCTLHRLPPPNCQWTAEAIDVAMEYMEADNVYLEVVEQRENCLPSVKLLISESDEEGEREGELIDLSDVLLNNEQLFEQNLPNIETAASTSTLSPLETPTPTLDVSSSSIEKTGSTAELCAVLKNLDLSSPSVDAIHPGKSGLDLPELIALDSDTTCSRCSESISPSLESVSEKPSREEGGGVAVELRSNSQELLDASRLLTPPSSGESLAGSLSPRTPPGLPSKNRLSSSSLSPSPESKPEASISLSPSNPFSLQQVSPKAVQRLPCPFPLGQMQVPTGIHQVCDIKKIRRELNFVTLEPKSTVPVIVSWAASPSKFTMQLVDNLGEIHNLLSELTKTMDKDNLTMTPSAFSLSVDQIQPGLVCSAFANEQLFRVLVLEAPVSPPFFDVKVEYLDYGGSDRVAVTSLRQLPDTFRQFPFQGISASLNTEKVAAKLTDIDMDGTITVQLLGPGLNQLEHLMNIINETYRKKQIRAADFISKVEVGMVCCAIFSDDSKWYRVVVKEVTSSKRILVEYVDYGNEEEVEKTKLRKKLDHHLFKLPFQAVKCTLHRLPPPNCQWTAEAIDVAMEYMEADNVYLEVVEQRENSLPSVKLLISESDEEGEREGELIDLSDVLLSDEQLFELGRNPLDVSDIEAAAPTPTSSSTPEKPAPSPENVQVSPSSGNSVDTISDGMRNLALPASDGAIHPGKSDKAVTKVCPGEGNPPASPANLKVYVQDGSVSPEDKSVLVKTGSGPVSPSLEFSSEKPSREEEEGRGGEVVEHSQELLKVDNSYEAHQLLTPPSSGDNLSGFSPHTPSGSPSHIGSTPPQSPSNMVHSESSNSLSSAAPFSPRTPLSSPPSVGGTPVHVILGGGASKVCDIKKIRRELNFVTLEPKSTVPVIVSWAASPSKFTVQLLNNLEELDNMSTKLTESMINMTTPSAISLSVDQIQPGLVCSAFTEEQWFRVLVLEAPVSPSSFDVKVEYLDYGGSDRVAVTSLRQLPDTFRQFPFQGISASLNNITPCGGSWSPEALEYFEGLFNEKQLFAVVNSVNVENTSYKIFLLDTCSVPGSTLNLGQELIKKGFAK